jgi:hypothetical protein
MSEGLVIPLSSAKGLQYNYKSILIQFEKLAIARSYHRPMSSARGTLIKLLVTCNSGVKVRNVAATVSDDEHVASQRGQLINAVAVGALRLFMS